MEKQSLLKHCGFVIGNVMANDWHVVEHGHYLSFSRQWGRNNLNEVARTAPKMVR